MVPSDHLLQTMHQFAILVVNKVVSACASETGLRYKAVIYISTPHLLVLYRAASDAVEYCLLWAHSPG